jgi:type IV pilus assembly protein PilY1
VGSTFSQGGTCYYVIKAYTSGATFGISDTANSNSAYVAGAPTSRTIYTKGSSSLANFAWAGTTPGVDSLTTAQKAYFNTPYITYVAGPPATGLSQFCTSGTCLTSTEQTNAAGEPLVNFLKGDRTNEGTFFRERKHVLGDIVSSEARYVKAPQFSYSDPGYSAYKTAQESRQAAVYVASNDGMLHAFNAETGQELWAYIPEMVLPQLYRLADKNYSQNHRYFVDGTPEVGDVCISNCTNPATAVWKTILVGGLNGGGKGYYALDITDPASPVLLWEFTHANMGYSYGNPRITKLKTGEWVVLLTSGYNNVADGFGYLFVLNAYDKTLIRTINTGAGSSATPSGLAKISAYSTTSETDNTTLAVYGGDMLGNLWRFDINGDIGNAGWEAHRLVTFLDGTGTPQPITAKPVETTIEGKPVIYVGTGSYLGINDVTSTTMQTMYAVKDNLGTSTYSNPRANSDFVEQTLVAATCTTEPSCTPGEAIRKIPPTTPPTSVDWATQNGWYVDFLTAGERAATDPALALGTLVFTTNTPNNASVDACGIPGVDSSSSWIYFLDYKTGGPVSTAGGVVATTLGNVIATRPVLVRLPDGTVLAMIRTSSANSAGGGSGNPSGVSPGYYPGAMEGSGTKLKKPPIAPSGGPSRRVSWREITND